MPRFEGRSALVTGGAGALGEAVARRLAAEGAFVLVADLPGSNGPQIADAIGGRFFALDVRDEAAWREAVARAAAERGRLDVLVNAAGITGDVEAGALATTTLAEWRRVLSINLDGVFLGCREAMPAMKRTGGGAIVNISSVGGYYPTPQNVAYGASKAALTQLTKSVALEGGALVRCNSVHPGIIESPMLKDVMDGMSGRGDGRSWLETAAARLPASRLGRPDDVAAITAFLASEEAGYITGSEYTVDGGWRLLR